ncbi:MAG: acetate--CoA ligase [Phycisphaerales bacterium]|jgi:acetyl-CoA synthetase|nr:acetate--CoA ligase [Phycisphaerales bacterium]
MSENTNIESVLHETRTFDPPENFDQQIGGAYIKTMDEYTSMHKRSIENPEEFWGSVADELDWFERWDTVVSGEFPDATWFEGGKTNICHNCIDRQIAMGHGDDTAIIWEGEPYAETPEVRTFSYYDLHAEVCRFANALKAKGVKKGDVVTIYMGMVPELAIATLACARIGAPHSVIFGGFSSQAIADRVEDAKSSIVITCDGSWRRGKVVPLKDNVDAATELTDLIETVIVLQRCHNAITWTENRDYWWHDLTDGQEEDCLCEQMEAEDMLFLLYTSGSTGKPKGIVHTTGGYMVYTYLTSKYVFNLRPDCNQIYWCTADVGWITGHSYIIYGILPNRVPTLMYEGAPNFPQGDRFWDIVERHKVTQFYTAPTAIRAFMKWGDAFPNGHDLSSLKVLGTVGEPINPEAWMWYRETIGGNRCPIVDTWWQTETGGQMLTPLPGATPTTPGSCTRPFFGVDAAVVNEDGTEVGSNSGGLLVVRTPWPATLRGVYGDRQRFLDTYFGRIDGMYLAGDSARIDDSGNFWIMGRIDDVINVSGHRLGTMEVESSLVSHESIVEAAVVGVPHEIKGTGIAAFCTLASGVEPTGELKATLRQHVGDEIGAIAKPDILKFTDALPKTRSGKIMRRLLRDVAAGTDSNQDVTTLEDFTVLAKLRDED